MSLLALTGLNSMCRPVDRAGLELRVPPEYWDYKHMSPLTWDNIFCDYAVWSSTEQEKELGLVISGVANVFYRMGNGTWIAVLWQTASGLLPDSDRNCIFFWNFLYLCSQQAQNIFLSGRGVGDLLCLDWPKIHNPFPSASGFQDYRHTPPQSAEKLVLTDFIVYEIMVCTTFLT